jgi:PTH2 family peptidyl-tRNA hydrolase
MSNVKMVIVVRKDLSMRKGKLAAQVAHASMKFLIDNNDCTQANKLEVCLSSEEAEWMFGGSFAKVVVGCDSEEELNNLLFKANLANIQACPIIDEGRTEFNGVPTLTCAAFGPAESEDLDPITGNLKLL